MLAKFKKKYIGDWDFYQKYLLLAIPMILQNAITIIPGLSLPKTDRL